MTGTRSEGNENTTDPIMSDDRSVLMFILVEPRMRSEEERFRTFQDWPSDAPVTAVDLAKAGFYFLGTGDKVRCFCCGGILRYWVHGDSPLGEHKRHFPTCSFVLGRNVGNIQQIPAPGSSDAVDGQLLSQLQRMTVDDQVVVGQAVYPEMEAEESRLTTFHNWPTGALVQPEVLARAGFFYTGHGDNVKCFYCDGGLRNWEPGDDPWQEHAKWFPRCEFLLQTRGQQYVSNIQESYFSIGETGSPKRGWARLQEWRGLSLMSKRKWGTRAQRSSSGSCRRSAPVRSAWTSWYPWCSSPAVTWSCALTAQPACVTAPSAARSSAGASEPSCLKLRTVPTGHRITTPCRAR
ncbi:baculoviral IAP repeat-containing protein 7 isoform X2 [Conger conger]|uniref:baculoviral IAP repeat-containing protein 7 isoform X2 n=1 Tax=Conger conger TaxID=82655 RepID=UPI002A59AB3D|nr:baculoviral IAP repeat-containing protein 7 isoform X2 [Conger conger]